MYARNTTHDHNIHTVTDNEVTIENYFPKVGENNSQ